MMNWDDDNCTQRLWARDASLWTNANESSLMGWLNVVQASLANASELIEFSQEIRDRGFKHIVLLGMGGSSLCARVLRKTFGIVYGFPELHVIDSTDPSQILRFAGELSQTVFIVSSKSGTTLETSLLQHYFQSQSRNLMAITDPDSQLDISARENNYMSVFSGVESIGGRFSALSNFGMVPAALMGVNIVRLLESAKQMFHACGPSVTETDNPGVSLGLFLGRHLLKEQDKLTLLISPKIAELGSWIEQLVAESTGKNGKGLIPIDKEPFGRVEDYSRDRVFTYTRLEGDDNAELDRLVEELKSAGHPVHVMRCRDKFELGAEFYRWEFATAVVGSIMGVNPFDQPDVESTKVATRRITENYEAAAPSLEAPDLKALLASIRPRDYFSICAFIEMNDQHDKILREIRGVVRAQKGVATTHGFGPCFLHSTGQLHKGGPDTGVFLQITCDDQNDITIPGEKLSFGQIKESQARADMSVLQERGRRCMRYHIKGDVSVGLRALKAQLL